MFALASGTVSAHKNPQRTCQTTDELLVLGRGDRSLKRCGYLDENARDVELAYIYATRTRTDHP